MKVDCGLKNLYTTKLKITVNSPAGEKYVIYLPKIVKSSGGTQIQTGSGFITADFNFSAIGDGKNPPLALDSMGSPKYQNHYAVCPHHKSGPEVQIAVNNHPVEGNLIPRAAAGETVDVTVTIL